MSKVGELIKEALMEALTENLTKRPFSHKDRAELHDRAARRWEDEADEHPNKEIAKAMRKVAAAHEEASYAHDAAHFHSVTHGPGEKLDQLVKAANETTKNATKEADDFHKKHPDDDE